MAEVDDNDESALETVATREESPRRTYSMATLTVAALGVVFGDLGTSPLYSIRECFHGEFAIAATSANVLGVISLAVWALLIVVTIKYVVFVLQADNRGEGGVLAMTSLVSDAISKASVAKWLLVALGIFGAALLYGDGMITPAISVLSAVEGLQVYTPQLQPYVVPLTVAILLGLFALQHRGTARVGALFGPVMVLWFAAIAVLGAAQMVRQPGILEAIAPWHGIRFLLENGRHGFLVLGAVFLVLTGAEALYADLGHFGGRPIRTAWFCLVFPSLLLNYFGQGALLLSRPENVTHPFYGLVPSWGLLPMTVLATTATVIASQAVITGAYSLTRQAVQLGYLPRLRVLHTSAKHIGQIYVPSVNWVLLVCTIGLILGFGTSSRLAAAYGVAVTSTMLITTVLFFVVVRRRWKWPWIATVSLTGLFLIVDGAFFGANISKILHGAWFPLVVGAVIFTIMRTWKKGRDLLGAHYDTTAVSWEHADEMLANPSITRVKGQAIYLTGSPAAVPSAMLHNLKHNKVLHSPIAVLHISSESTPRVPDEEKVQVSQTANGIYRIDAHYGFMESPNIDDILTMARALRAPFKTKSASFFLGRERLLPQGTKGMALWRKKLFVVMARNSMDASAFYGIPPNRVVELGSQLKL